MAGINLTYTCFSLYMCMYRLCVCIYVVCIRCVCMYIRCVSVYALCLYIRCVYGVWYIDYTTHLLAQHLFVCVIVMLSHSQIILMISYVATNGAHTLISWPNFSNFSLLSHAFVFFITLNIFRSLQSTLLYPMRIARPDQSRAYFIQWEDPSMCEIWYVWEGRGGWLSVMHGWW